jgi:hypothetical protein
MAESAPTASAPFVTAINVPPFSVSPVGDVARIGYQVTGFGPALNVALVGAPVVVNVNLDLIDDEVAIGGPTAGAPPGTRALYQGRADLLDSVIECIPRVVGDQTTLLGKVEDTAALDADVGVPAYRVRRDAPAANAADGDYIPSIADASGASWERELKPDTVPLGTAIPVALVEISLGAANADRFTVTFFNNSTNTVYIGPTGVLVANGMPLLRGASITLEATIEWFAIAAVAGPSDVRVLEQSY